MLGSNDFKNVAVFVLLVFITVMVIGMGFLTQFVFKCRFSADVLIYGNDDIVIDVLNIKGPLKPRNLAVMKAALVLFWIFFSISVLYLVKDMFVKGDNSLQTKTSQMI